jgi:chromatin structure-remodeling complex subunit RSC9
MVARDFITNVTNVFPTALARVVPNEQDKTQSRYTMKGISPRAIPIDLRGRAFTPCLWKIPVRQTTEPMDEVEDPVQEPVENLNTECDYWFSPTNAEEMWVHLVEEHLEVPRDPDNPRKFRDGLLQGTGRKFACQWAGCNRYPAPGIEDAHKVCMHLKVHLPDHGPGASTRAKYTRDPDRPPSPPSLDRHYLNTPVDEHGQPVGLPLSSVLVLRNLARQMLKIDENAGGRQGGTSLIQQHFAMHQEKIFHVMTFNKSLRAYTPDFVDFVSRGLHLAHKLPRLVGPTGD